jgi:D-glucosaminate-6-phosphate ammonia-lyase
VTFSGGKGMRGPQSCGLLLGRKDLVEAARLNCSPNSDSIGRGMKVNKEEMLGMMVAVEMYLKRDAKAEWKEWERRTHVVTDAVKNVKSVMAEVYVPPIANHVPTVRIKWDKATLNLTADQVRQQMRDGQPAIEIAPNSSPATAATQEIGIGIWQLQPGEVDIVAKRLKDIIKA